MNIILAEDFAQIPLVGGSLLLTKSIIETQVHSGLKPHGQVAIFGKSLWWDMQNVHLRILAFWENYR